MAQAPFPTGKTEQTLNGRHKESESSSYASSRTLNRRKTNGAALTNAPRNVYGGPKNVGNMVKERVLSAKLLKLRTLQNQLNDANYRLAEIAQENKILKTLQKRQDRALLKYEDSKADLPRLITCHQEDVRCLQTKNKSLRKTIKDLTDQLKAKDEDLCGLKDQYKHLVALSKNRHLEEREKLHEKVQDLEEQLARSDGTISNLNRKLIIESKNAKHKLNAETIKNKQTQKEVNTAMIEIERLANLLEIKEKGDTPSAVSSGSFSSRSKRFLGATHRQATSLVSLHETHKEKNVDASSTSSSQLLHDAEDQNGPQPVTNLKLEPIFNGTSCREEQYASKSTSNCNGMGRSPMDNIKARLSAKSQRSSVDSLDYDCPTLKVDENSADSGIFVTSGSLHKSRPTSSTKQRIDGLTKTLETVKVADDTGTLEEYCNGLATSTHFCNDVVAQYTEDFKHAQEDTEKILDNLYEADSLNKELMRNKYPKVNVEEVDTIARMIPDVAKIDRNDLDLITGDRKESKNLLRDITTSVEADPVVRKEHKQKLLEALRAIDNGENVEIISKVDTKRKNKLLNDLFGDVNKLTSDV